jgi:hypothetical protein
MGCSEHLSTYGIMRGLLTSTRKQPMMRLKDEKRPSKQTEPACYDGRREHTYQRPADIGGWWCDYCGIHISREPTAKEIAMKPGVSP